MADLEARFAPAQPPPGSGTMAPGPIGLGGDSPRSLPRLLAGAGLFGSWPSA